MPAFVVPIWDVLLYKHDTVGHIEYAVLTLNKTGFSFGQGSPKHGRAVQLMN